jgi:trehalose 6-phosphate phosphatase
LGSLSAIASDLGGRRPCFFLDFDGTLAPLALRPELAELPPGTRAILDSLAGRHPVCFVSGRALAELRHKIGIENAYYAAEHGQQILGPPESGVFLEVGTEYKPALREAAADLERRLTSISGAVIERKGLSISVHYRLVPHGLRTAVEQSVRQVALEHPRLRLSEGKMLYEFRPPGHWDKGQAVLWLLERLGTAARPCCPICLGDDLTDEDMFAAVGHSGVTVVVGPPRRPTRARYYVRDHEEVAILLDALATGRPA